jgi:hypothetical protein
MNRSSKESALCHPQNQFHQGSYRESVQLYSEGLIDELAVEINPSELLRINRVKKHKR